MKLTQNQFLGLKKDLPLKFYEGSTYIAVDTEEVYIYNRLEKPVLIGSKLMYDSKDIVFAYASNINASNIAVPTEYEITAWNESLPEPYTDTIFYYNETDNSNLEATASFYVDNTGKIVRLGYKQEQEIDINRPDNVYLNYQNQSMWYGWVPQTGNSTTINDIVNHSNDIGFTIDKEVLALLNFKVIDKSGNASTAKSIKYVKYLFKKNNIEGDWGNSTANGPIVPADLILISEGAAVKPGGGVNDVVIDLGDISTDDIVTYLNNNPQPTSGQNWEIDSNSDYWFSYTSNNQDIVDFYKGPRPVVLGNQIGSNYVVVADDFQRISTDGQEVVVGVQSVTGDGVDNTDPQNPVLTFPLPNEIGLGNVDNTSDADKPISTAQQQALYLKVDKVITITGSNGLTGGGDLSANRTIQLNAASVASLALANSALQEESDPTVPQYIKDITTEEIDYWNRESYILQTRYDQDIFGLRDGVNKTFILQNDNYLQGTLSIWLDGIRLSKGNNYDYTELNAGQSENGAVINRVITPKNLLIFEFIKNGQWH